MIVNLYDFNKYHAIKKMVDNIAFDSKKEAARYSELKLLQRAKTISDLKIQQPFRLQEGFTDKQGNYHKPITYIADFFYWVTNDPENVIVEDTKGVRTDVYKLKKKLLLHQYPDIIFIES